MDTDFTSDIDAVQRIDAVPRILEIVCRSTRMGFAAVARVTDGRWVCCAVRDEIEFGLQPGSELVVETTSDRAIRPSPSITLPRTSFSAGITRRPNTASKATSPFQSF
jgi:hypothetical protein